MTEERIWTKLNEIEGKLDVVARIDEKITHLSKQVCQSNDKISNIITRVGTLESASDYLKGKKDIVRQQSMWAAGILAAIIVSFTTYTFAL